jgi:pimeloyl-ACP methyl ester carboxylesterase
VVEAGTRDEPGWPLLYFRRRYLRIERAEAPTCAASRRPDRPCVPTVRANGIDIAYTVEGAGPPLVMLHGATSTALEDWPPSGRSSARRSASTWSTRAATAARAGTCATASARHARRRPARLRRCAGPETFHLVGFSMGAMTALTFATRHPKRLRTAIICGIDVAREPRASVARRLMDPERILREEPEWAAQLERRHGPVQGEGAWQRLLRAIATTSPRPSRC